MKLALAGVGGQRLLLEPHLLGELSGSVAHQQGVPCVFQNPSGHSSSRFDATHGPHSSYVSRVSVHQHCVQTRLSGLVRAAAKTDCSVTLLRLTLRATSLDSVQSYCRG